MGRRHRLSNIHRKYKIHLIQPEKLQNSKRPNINIWIKRERIQQVKQHRILGLIFDSRMTWNEHILYDKAKAEKKINLIKCLSHTKWGADQENLIKIHRMIILSTLRYGEEAYGSASQAILKKLEPTHTSDYS
jgi:hypothetical protein